VPLIRSLPLPAVPPCSTNPANWMLAETSPANEHKLGLEFGEVYRTSELAK
jgi:hypothetical protein